MSLIDELYREDRSIDAALVEEYEQLLGNTDRTRKQESRFRELEPEMQRIFPKTNSRVRPSKDDIYIRSIKEIINNHADDISTKAKGITRAHRIGFIAGISQCHAKYRLRHLGFANANKLVTRAFDELGR